MKKVGHHLRVKSSKLMQSLVLGNFQAAFSGKGLEFRDFRAYSYGDDAKYIDWATSSREGSLVMRRYKEDKEASIFCVADMNTRIVGLSSLKTKLLSEICENIGDITLVSGEKFGGFKIYEGKNIYIPPKKSPVGLFQFLQKDDIPTRNPHTPLDISCLLQSGLKRSIIFVVSDELDLNMQSFQVAAKKHDLVYIHISTHFENTLEGGGITHLRGGKTIAIDLSDQKKKLEYRLKRKTQLSDLRSQLLSRGIESIFLDETTSFVGEFLKLMKRRERSALR